MSGTSQVFVTRYGARRQKKKVLSHEDDEFWIKEQASHE